MGCDIHGPFIEQPDFYHRPEGGTCHPSDPGAIPHWGLLAELDFGRDYELFAVLADVRNEGDVRPVSPPKGLPWGGDPEDPPGSLYSETMICSWRYLDHLWPPDDGGKRSPSDCHSHSWLTLPEVVAAHAEYINTQGHPNSDLAVAIAVMTTAISLNPDYPCRMVFCFDS